MFSFPRGMAAAVQWDGLFLTSFDVTNDTKANCVMVPVVFHSSLNGSRTPTVIFKCQCHRTIPYKWQTFWELDYSWYAFCKQFYTHSNIVRTDFGTNKSFFSCGVEHSCLLLELRKQNPSTYSHKANSNCQSKTINSTVSTKRKNANMWIAKRILVHLSMMT